MPSRKLRVRPPSSIAYNFFSRRSAALQLNRSYCKAWFPPNATHATNAKKYANSTRRAHRTQWTQENYATDGTANTQKWRRSLHPLRLLRALHWVETALKPRAVIGRWNISCKCFIASSFTLLRDLWPWMLLFAWHLHWSYVKLPKPRANLAKYVLKHASKCLAWNSFFVF